MPGQLIRNCVTIGQTKKHGNVRHVREEDQKCDLICPGQPVLQLPSNFLRNCTSVHWSGPTTTTKPPKITTLQATTTEEESEESTESTGSENSTERRHGIFFNSFKKLIESRFIKCLSRNLPRF